MKKRETREVIATYCDYCGAELTHFAHSNLILNDGIQLDFCNQYSDTLNMTCLDKYKNEQHVLRLKQPKTE